MIQDVLSQFDYTLWPRLVLVFFVLLFSAIVVWTFRGEQDRFHRISRLPLDDEEKVNPDFLRGESGCDTVRADA